MLGVRLSHEHCFACCFNRVGWPLCLLPGNQVVQLEPCVLAGIAVVQPQNQAFKGA